MKKLRESVFDSFPKHLLTPRQSAALDEWFAQHIAWCDDLDWARSFACACPIPGARAEDYNQRVLQVGEHTLLAGIRFLGGDTTRPFIDIVCGTVQINELRWDELSGVLTHEFSVFTPESVRVVVWGDESQPSRAGAIVDQVLVAGLVGDLIDRREVARADVRCEPIVPTDASRACDLVEGWYEDWAEAEPWRRGRVFAIDEESTSDCIERGVALWVRRGGAPIGVVASAREREATTGLFGWCVHEEVVARACSGEGIGTFAQAQLTEAICALSDDEEVLFGTIDAENVGSIATAHKRGRAQIARFEFLPLTESQSANVVY